MSKTLNGRVKLKDIDKTAFIMPTDSMALANLERVPVLPELLHAFNKHALDRLLYVQNTCSSVRCGPHQFPTLHKLLKEACKILDIENEPELYVRYHAVDNAYTAGVERVFIVLNSPLIDTLTDDELLFLIGHELGHIKCEHMLYQTVGKVLIPLIQTIGDATLGLGRIAGMALFSAFFEWMRQAEFSCDRAGLLTVQDPSIALSATMKMGAGMTRLSSEMSVEAFLEQARAHIDHKPEEGLAKAFLFLMRKWMATHPDIVYRAKAIDDWARNGSYLDILDGKYSKID